MPRSQYCARLGEAYNTQPCNDPVQDTGCPFQGLSMNAQHSICVRLGEAYSSPALHHSAGMAARADASGTLTSNKLRAHKTENHPGGREAPVVGPRGDHCAANTPSSARKAKTHAAPRTHGANPLIERQKLQTPPEANRYGAVSAKSQPFVPHCTREKMPSSLPRRRRDVRSK